MVRLCSAVSWLCGQAVVKTLLLDLDSFLPQAVSCLARKTGHSCSGVIAPRRRAQRAGALPPFRLKIMSSMLA
jgi:hypothetical protein